MPTKMNDGSGDWWLYGEDYSHYYHFTGNNPSDYDIISKKAAKNCVGFEKYEVRTWCGVSY
jgi:hypothetical protein